MVFTKTGNTEERPHRWADFNSKSQNCVQEAVWQQQYFCHRFTDTSDTIENSKETCFKSSSRWLAKFKASQLYIDVELVIVFL